MSETTPKPRKKPAPYGIVENAKDDLPYIPTECQLELKWSGLTHGGVLTVSADAIRPYIGLT
ncbi:MAG: hypothetical protein O4861_04895 [Trichodesmium sp. St16_bin4-tuft]|nr:hypothetical protein [Trichodesmium sp. St16_bin4-tuft]